MHALQLSITIRLEMPASVSLFLARVSPAPPTGVDRLIARYGVTRIGDVMCVNRVLDEGPSDMPASDWLCYVRLPVCWQEKESSRRIIFDGRAALKPF